MQTRPPLLKRLSKTIVVIQQPNDILMKIYG